ncbi:MAG: hypothetical protein ABFD44_10840 [Anaerolineaceae bacterium]
MPEPKKRTYEADTLAALTLRPVSTNEGANPGAVRSTRAPERKETDEARTDVVRRLIEYQKDC